MMRYKIGSIVEVFTKKKADFGSWRCAVIVADNGDSYTMRYHHLGGISKCGVKKVKVEDIRPCAPLTDSCVTWSVGDVVEVLDRDGYWRVSMIKEVLGDDYYQIAVVGSIDEFRVDNSRIRVRQEWKENRWRLLEKGSADCEAMVYRMHRRIHMQHQQHQECDYNLQLVPDSSYISKMLKRSSPDSPIDSDSCSEYSLKRRAITKESDDYYDLAAKVDDAYSFVGNVDIRTYPRKNPIKAEFFARSAKPVNSVSNISSVASCSNIDAISSRVQSHSSASCSEDNDCLVSDAESFRTLGHEEGVSTSQSKLVDSVRTHDSDLRSYHYILETLHASGPLTWDLETLLTNLRMKFCVSNDEHLSELRRLKCIRGFDLRCH